MDWMTKATESMKNYLKKYYTRGRFEKADFWDWAEIFEILDDALENTKDPAYVALIEETYTAFVADNGSTWEENPFNDDIMWAVIAMTRAYRLTGEKKYLDTAVKNFDLTWERAYSDDLGGGLWWRIENNTKNACVNCPGAIAACLLGDALGEEEYFAKARSLMDWTVAELYEPCGKVYDNYPISGEKSRWSSTYNQGTFIGANWLLYKHYNDEICLARAEAAADYTMNEMYHGEVMNNEESGGDLIGFKGILSRWLSRYAKDQNRPVYLDWLRKNAEAAYGNRNSEGLIWTQFANKTEEKYYDVFGTSAAVAVLVNVL